MTTPTANQLSEENKLLSTELNRVEDLLAQSRAERDELGIKYNALSERVSLTRFSPPGDPRQSSPSPSVCPTLHFSYPSFTLDHVRDSRWSDLFITNKHMLHITVMIQLNGWASI